MALIKIYTLPENRDKLVSDVAGSIKLIAAAALNVSEVPTSPSSVETVFSEGIDLIGIDYIIEIITVERPNQQRIAEAFIEGMSRVYPDLLFSVYFNNITESGMANTPRASIPQEPITIDEAVKRSRL